MTPIKEKGFTLLEVLGAIVITSMLTVPFIQMANNGSKQTKDTATAQHLKMVMDASARYVQDNAAIIQSNATATTPAVVTVDMLVNTNYLSPAFKDTNPYGQTTQVEILQPSAGNLDTKVITIGGITIPDTQGPGIAAKVGAAGGFTPSSAPDTAKGSYGGWTETLANNTKPGAGHLVGLLYFSNGQLITDFLHRHSVAGHPEANAMYTPLHMKALATEDTSDALCSVADATSYGRIAADATGAVLSCQSGVWKKQGSSYWKDPVNTFTALPTTDPIGTVRMTTDTGRGFMWNGTAWTPLGLDQNGNLTLPGTLTAGKVQFTDVVVENTACPTNGLTARDSTGLILSCQSGVWRKVGAALNAKWANSGGVTDTGFSYAGTTAEGLAVWCKSFTYTATATAIVFGSLNTWSNATQTGYSELVAYIALDTGTVSSNYTVAAQSGGGFNVSTALIDTVSAGTHAIYLCTEERGTTGFYGVSYSASVLQ